MDIETVMLVREGKTDETYIAELEDAILKLSCQTEFLMDALVVSTEALEDVAGAYQETGDADSMFKFASLALTILCEDSESPCH